MATEYKLADGHDDVGSLQTLNQLAIGTTNKLYADGFRSRWYPYEARLMGGNRQYVELGLPYSVWVLPFLTRAELEILLAIGPEVTVRTYHKTEDRFANFNGSMAIADFVQDMIDRYGEWNDVEITFYDLVEIV